MRAWEFFLEKLKTEFEEETFLKWVKALTISRFDARNLYLEAPSPMHLAWFEEHIRPKLKYFQEQPPIKVHIALSHAQEKKEEKKPLFTFTVNADRIDPELSFHNFIPSSQNLMAFKILQEQTSFNPIYLFGPKHSGKTHLLSAAATLALSQKKKAFFVRAETFTSHVVQAIRLGQMQRFREVYRDIDVLFVDDVEMLAKKDATQEEFFHTFNALHTIGKQIVLSSSLAPSKLVDIEPRLISRFEWGICIKIEQSPPLEILKQKATAWKLPYEADLLELLAREFPHNSLMALQALSLRSKAPNLSPKEALRLLSDLKQNLEKKPISPETIVDTVAKHYGVLPQDILGKSQKKENALPRQVAMFFCREMLELPFQKIGEIFNKDHSTVMASIKNIQEKKIALNLQEIIPFIKNKV